MCGIAGQIGYERNMRQMSAVMAQMSAAIAPRGPDASGIYVDDNAYLVHRRLAVIDPDNGSQPMSSRGFTGQNRRQAAFLQPVPGWNYFRE